MYSGNHFLNPTANPTQWLLSSPFTGNMLIPELLPRDPGPEGRRVAAASLECLTGSELGSPIGVGIPFEHGRNVWKMFGKVWKMTGKWWEMGWIAFSWRNSTGDHGFSREISILVSCKCSLTPIQ